LSHRFNFTVLVSTFLAFLITYLDGYYYNNFPVAHQPYSGLGRLIPEVSRSHTGTQQSEDSSGRVISPTQRPLTDNTQHLQETYINAADGIRTRNPR